MSFGNTTGGNFLGSSLSFGKDLEEEDDSADYPNATEALLADAAVRADQQLMCRDTMLNLKEAFEGALHAQQSFEERQRREARRMQELKEERLRLMEALREMEETVAASERRIAEVHASRRALEQGA